MRTHLLAASSSIPSADMKAFLDGRPLAAEPTLESALRAGAAEAHRAGRRVVGVSLDGHPLSESDILQALAASGAGEVRLTSSSDSELADALQAASMQLAEARGAQGRCGEAIQIGNVDDAFNGLSAILMAWTDVQKAAERVRVRAAITLAYSEHSPDDLDGSAGMGPLVTRLTAALNEIKRTIQHRDWSALGDVLSYEMGEQADEWSRVLSGWADGLVGSGIRAPKRGALVGREEGPHSRERADIQPTESVRQPR